MIGEIHVDQSASAEGVLLVRVRPYMLIAFGLLFTVGSCVGFVRCFAPFDNVPYDKMCLGDDGGSIFLPLIMVFCAGLFIIYFFVSWDDFWFDKNSGQLKITRKHVFREATEETMNLRDIREVIVVKRNGNGDGETSRVEMKTDRLAVPLTSYYSSGSSEHNRAAVAIEQFLGLDRQGGNHCYGCMPRCNCHLEPLPMLRVVDVEAYRMEQTCTSAVAVPVRGEECDRLLPLAVATPAGAAEGGQDFSISKALPVK